MNRRVEKALSRYVSRFPREPVPEAELAALETALGVVLPADLRAIAAVASGAQFEAGGLLPLAGPDTPGGVADRTLALRREYDLPARFVLLQESRFRAALLETRRDPREAAPVLVVPAEALADLGREGFVYGPHTTYGTYTAWFEGLLDEEREAVSPRRHGEHGEGTHGRLGRLSGSATSAALQCDLDPRLPRLIEHYLARFPEDPVPPEVLAGIERDLGLFLPSELKAVAAVASGAYLPCPGLLVLAGAEVEDGVTSRTLALRRQLCLRDRFLVTREGPSGPTLLDTQPEAQPGPWTVSSLTLRRDGSLYRADTGYVDVFEGAVREAARNLALEVNCGCGPPADHDERRRYFRALRRRLYEVPHQERLITDLRMALPYFNLDSDLCGTADAR